MTINNNQNQCQCAHVIRDNADNNVIPSQRQQQCNSEPMTTTPKSRDNDDNSEIRKVYQYHPKRTREQEINDTYILKQQIERMNSENDNKGRKYNEDDNDDNNRNNDNNKKEREKKQCEQERKEEM